jgi:pyruvate-ferredoxin/flavodoxin oxidoreductase
LPKTVTKIAVLDRMKDAGAEGEPLYKDMCAAFTNRDNVPKIYGGRYGLSSKDTNPAQIKAVFDNLKSIAQESVLPWASTTMSPGIP